MAARRNPASLVGEQMLQALRHGKEQGGSSYPPTLRELADADAALMLKAAAARNPFGAGAVAVQPKNLDSPAALKGDEQALLAHPRTLAFLVELSCSAQSPAVEPGKLKAKVPKALRGAWERVLERHLERLPDGIELLRVGRKRLLHLKRHPLPPPPEEALAQRMIERLRSRRGDADYPPALAVLQREAAAGASAALINKALSTARFKEAALLGMKARGDAPVALAEDRQRLARSDSLLLAALRAVRTGIHQVAGVGELKKKVAADVQAEFAASLPQRHEDAGVPSGIGCLREKKGPVFFFLEDVRSTPRADPARSKTRVRASGDDAIDFERAFDAVFAELDRAKGGHNFVSLLELRPRVPVPRQTFDEGLWQLRRGGKYTMSASEGRHGLTAEELEAGVREDGAHLLYVSRKMQGSAGGGP